MPSLTEHSASSDTDLQPGSRIGRAWEDRARDPIAACTLGRELLAGARQRGDAPGTAGALRLLAWGETIQGAFKEAEACAAESLEIARALADRDGEALSLALLGNVMHRGGDARRAQEPYQEARRIAGEIGARGTEAMAMNGLARVFDEMGEYATAMGLYREALAIAVDAGAGDEAAGAWLGIGNAYEGVADYHEALAAYRNALAIAEKIGHLQFQAYATGNIGMTYERIGDIATALSYELRGLDLQENMGDRWGAGISLNNIGIIYQGLGNYARALEYLFRALEYAERIGDRVGQMAALHNIGHLYESLGDAKPVFDQYQRILAIARDVGDRRGEAFALGDIGRVHARLGENRQALLHFLRALRLHQEINDRFGERATLEAIASVYMAEKSFDRALSYAADSYRIAETTGDRRGMISAAVALGTIHSRRGAHQEGVELLERALRMTRDGGYVNDMMRVTRALAEACQLSGDAVRGRKYHRLYQDSVHRVFNREETLRTRQLIAGFERRQMRDKAELMGLLPEDLDILFELEESTGGEQGGEDAAGAAERRGNVPDAAPVVAVSTFGELRVVVDGRALRTADWGRKKARDLFKFLLIHHRRTVTLDEIIEKLWDGAADRNTELLVMNAVSRIRRALEPGRGPRDRNSMLSSVERTYRLDLGDGADIDFMQFKELIILARRASAAGERLGYYQEAAALFTDDFLKEDYDQEWTISERELLKDAFIEALEYIAGERLRAGSYEEAGETARRIISFDATGERGYEVLLESLLARGRSAEALQAYEECRATFLGDLGVEPPKSIREIVERR